MPGLPGSALPGSALLGSALPGSALPDSTQVWLIRHGETEWSRSGQHTGRTDLPLTPAGENQARALVTVLAGVTPALVLSSPRRRAQHTAELAGLTVNAIDDDLAEWDYGDYEGLTTPQIREQVPDWTVWTHPCPHGETPEQIRTRADRLLTTVAAHAQEGPVILVAHGHISRVIGARWVGLDVLDGGRLALGTAAPSLLGAQHGAPVIEHWNIPNPLAS